MSLTALLQVVLIDLVLAGDNAMVIGLAAAGLPEGATRQGDPDRHRRRDDAAHPVRRVDDANPADRRPPARGRDPAVVGMLENVARAARLLRRAESEARGGGAVAGTIRRQAPENTLSSDLADHRR